MPLPFGNAALPERLRLGAERQLPAFERIAHLAARSTACPMALVTLLTGTGQWNVGRFGIEGASLPLQSSICARVMPAQDLQCVQVSSTDARLATLELISELKDVRFYAGQPVLFRGAPVGMVCVLDRRARRLRPEDEQVLVDLAAIVAEHLETLEQGVVAQMERQRSEDFARASGDWLWELDDDLRYSWLSPNFEQATGLDPLRMLGRPAGGVTMVPQLITEEPARIQVLLQRHEDFSGVLVDVVFRGQHRIVKLNGLALRNEQGRFVGYRGTGRDVTELVAAVKAAERESLERETAQKTAEAKSAFLSRASHELRTPLNAIIGFTQLMLLDRSEELPARLRGQLEIVSREGDHLLNLVNDILDLSRLEHAGAAELTAMPLRPLADDVLALLQVDAGRRGVRLLNHVSPDVQAVADEHALRRVLLNIVSNGVKYNVEAGEVRVTGTVLDGRVLLVVEDTGKGIDARGLSELFQPFNRLGAQRTDVPGTGLGLVIARSLMETMNGELRVDSAVGNGTRVQLVLPAVGPTP